MTYEELIDLNQNLKRIKHDIMRLKWYFNLTLVSLMKFSANGKNYNHISKQIEIMSMIRTVSTRQVNN
jgi:hypothetical protein